MVVPTGILYALRGVRSLGLMGRAVSVCPSLTGWAIAQLDTRPGGRVGLVAGPELAHADEEVAALAEIHDSPELLTGEAATASARSI